MDEIKKLKTTQSQHGFTLLEITMVLLIFSLFILGGLAYFSAYERQQKITVTQANVENAYEQLQAFLLDNGHYPCPASISAARDSANYGVSGDCSDTTTVGFGACDNASAPNYCIEESIRTAAIQPVDFDLSDGVAATTITDMQDTANTPLRRVRVGAIPFRDLNIEESKTYDKYGSRLYYVVTESLANPTTYNDLNGAIQVVDNAGASLTAPAASTDMIIYSVGANKFGGYTRAGTLTAACPTNTLESRNCDYATENDATFVYAEASNGDNNNAYDDVFAMAGFMETDAAEGWRYGDPDTSGENPNDVVILDKSIMIGDYEREPTQALEVALQGSTDTSGNTSVVQDSIAQQYCDENGNNCFAISELVRNCPPGEYVTGIGTDIDTNDTKIICNEIYFGCTPDPITGNDMMLAGVNTDGTPICIDVPLELQVPETESVCPAETVVCGPELPFCDQVATGVDCQFQNCNDVAAGEPCSNEVPEILPNCNDVELGVDCTDNPGQCGEEITETTVDCPSAEAQALGLQYQIFSVQDCSDPENPNAIISDSNQTTACCTLQPGVVEAQCWPLTGSGINETETFTRNTELDSSSCSAINGTNNAATQCSCAPYDKTFEPTCGDDEVGDICSVETITLRLDPDASPFGCERNPPYPVTPGTCKPASFAVSLVGATSLGTTSGGVSLPEVGESCSVPNAQFSCRRPSGAQWEEFSNCRCAKIPEPCVDP